jgi:DNA-binding MarR family transcriptional regulator
MTSPPHPLDSVSMPVLLRHARTAYGSAMRTALAEAGYDDIPKNGLYVIGGLALQEGGHPLSELIEDLRISKQAAGQLVDTLVTRGYLSRDVDAEDRRKLTIALTERGWAAAKVQATARANVDAELLSCAGADDVGRARRVLSILIHISHELDARDANSRSSSL